MPDRTHITRTLFSVWGLLGLWLMLVPAGWAQTGKLSGQVVDDTGQPMFGATAFIIGTSLGAATDANGDYAIIRVPPGTYSVRFSSVGYQTKVLEGVVVSSNNTTTLNVTLSEEVIEGEEIVITAERPIVDVSLTSSIQTLSKEDIAVLPVQQLDDTATDMAVDGLLSGLMLLLEATARVVIVFMLPVRLSVIASNIPGVLLILFFALIGRFYLKGAAEQAMGGKR